MRQLEGRDWGTDSRVRSSLLLPFVPGSCHVLEFLTIRDDFILLIRIKKGKIPGNKCHTRTMIHSETDKDFPKEHTPCVVYEDCCGNKTDRVEKSMGIVTLMTEALATVNPTEPLRFTKRTDRKEVGCVYFHQNKKRRGAREGRCHAKSYDDHKSQ